MHPAIEEAVRDILNEDYVFPEDILGVIQKDETAWKNYRGFSDTYKRIRIAYIDSARDRPEEFSKRLDNFLRMTRKNKLIGYGGIEKYY